MPEEIENQKIEDSLPEQAQNSCPAEKNCKCKSNKTLICLLSILAVLGVGFGIYAWFFKPTDALYGGSGIPCPKCPECAESEIECPKCEECEKCEEKIINLSTYILNDEKLKPLTRDLVTYHYANELSSYGINVAIENGKIQEVRTNESFYDEGMRNKTIEITNNNYEIYEAGFYGQGHQGANFVAITTDGKVISFSDYQIHTDGHITLVEHDTENAFRIIQGLSREHTDGDINGQAGFGGMEILIQKTDGSLEVLH